MYLLFHQKELSVLKIALLSSVIAKFHEITVRCSLDLSTEGWINSEQNDEMQWINVENSKRETMCAFKGKSKEKCFEFWIRCILFVHLLSTNNISKHTQMFWLWSIDDIFNVCFYPKRILIPCYYALIQRKRDDNPKPIHQQRKCSVP